MASKNTSGMLVQCNHCGYSWYTQSQRDVTSCPNCGWRVRLKLSDRSSSSKSLTASRQKEVNYY